MKQLSLLLILSLILGCSAEEPMNQNPDPKLYFPSVAGDSWETTDPSILDWDVELFSELDEFLETNNTRAFIILKDGKIVKENYWGNNILNNQVFDENSLWYWASAGKCLTASLVGIAQAEGLLDIEDSSADYLGLNWSSLSTEQEKEITIKHHLTMTTGLDYTVYELDCTDPDCLQYRAEPGTQWYYHNAPYTLLEEIVSNAASQEYNTYTDTKIEEPIGMNGEWISLGYNNVYWSTARDMARFGLLILAEGQWDGEPVLSDQNYFDEMVNSSQELNPSYGYLWWLNGKESIVFPGFETSLSIDVAPEAPDEMIAAMGKNGQFVNIIPSENIVVIRMGEAPDGSLVPINFHNNMWEILGRIF